MPGLSSTFAAACSAATDVAAALERARSVAPRGSAVLRELHHKRLLYVYEAAYLRVFVAWEDFLESSFLRYLCGYAHAGGQVPTRPPHTYSATLAAGRTALFGTRSFLLWHGVDKVVSRSQRFFTNGPHELVLLSNKARLDWFSWVRHRVAHGHDDARAKFDTASMGLAGRRYPAARAGALLRDWVPGATLPTRWLEAISSELVLLSAQIVP